ncbi:hypothetical protein DL1_03615 [Thioclava dalianensis]|uniref:Asparagine synthetase domain-containing protein n=1 Tax=Thioclava dalianensis TaxID=1185766 RepID=A0A074THA7_9RHOB|nr:hypothetical protein [Thioclava dalianensis]KEP69545.1 hypothetical protein DL1_03615 [Thioclava dalianensis]SFN68238.1 hypothetical protein SAMN05216224_10956 [Thioclava dalianensis]
MALKKMSLRGYLQNQFLICDTKRPDFPDADVTFGRWSLYLGQSLSVARLLNPDRSTFGYVFGIAVDSDGEFLEGGYHDAPSPERAGWPAFEQWIESLTGRWGALVTDQGATRFYTDPSGSIGAVYDRNSRSLAASLGLCLTREVVDHPDYDHSAVEERGGRYTLFDTRDATARRMNPNCYLDLSDFSETRYWPRPESIALHNGRLADSYDLLQERTEKVMTAIAHRRRAWLPLTGGQDSRLLLAMAGRALEKIESGFAHVSNYANRRDAAIGERLAARMGFAFERHDYRDHKTKKRRAEVDVANFHAGLGFPMKAPSELDNGLHLKLPAGAVIFRGHQTGLLRAVFSERIGAQARRRLPWQVRRLLAVPRPEFDSSVHRRFRGRYWAWLNALPPCAEANSTDLMMLEIFYPSSVGAIFPAWQRTFLMSPFNGRQQLGIVLAMDEEYRRGSHPVHDIVERFAPQLNDIPFDYELPAKLGTLYDPDHMAQVTQARREATSERAWTLAEPEWQVEQRRRA